MRNSVLLTDRLAARLNEGIPAIVDRIPRVLKNSGASGTVIFDEGLDLGAFGSTTPVLVTS